MKTRARISAWLVFISMAGTTMSFQVYHSVKHGHMPWPLAYLYGIVPLLLAMLVIEFVSGWKDAPKWARPSAYLIIGGAMYLSASATGSVVFRAAPSHSNLLFGFLLDGAAILAARFLMNAAQVTAAAEAAALADTAEAAVLRAALEGERHDRETAEGERDTARDEAAQAAAATAALGEQVAVLQAHLEAALKGGTEKPKSHRRKGDAANPESPVLPDDVDTQAEALRILDEDPDITGSELGRRLGTTPGYGRTLKRRLAEAAPKGGN